MSRSEIERESHAEAKRRGYELPKHSGSGDAPAWAFVEGYLAGASRLVSPQEPTEAEVIAAAKAIHLAGWTYMGEHEPGCWCEDDQRVCLPIARAALSAARQVAPSDEPAHEMPGFPDITEALDKLTIRGEDDE